MIRFLVFIVFTTFLNAEKIVVHVLPVAAPIQVHQIADQDI